MRRLLMLIAAVASVAIGRSQSITRVEPMCWWVGMKTPLQLMIHGVNLKDSKVRSIDTGLTVKQVHNADSPNYLFVDVDVDPLAPAGEYRLEISKNGKKLIHKYKILKRRDDSADRGSFTSADMIYLLMPDRFADGDPVTNNTTNTIEKVNRANPNGRHGGDIQGIIDHLDYIRDLGATTIWSTPLTLDNEPTYSYHGYACCDYYLTDPRFGTNNLYRQMVDEVHKRGMKMIIDAVPNHCGTNHWWMKDLPFRNWIHTHPKFTRTNGVSISTSDPHSARINVKGCVDGWFDTSMPDINTENPFVLQYFKQMIVWWIEWADLDGVRVDTYPYNEKYTIALWTRAIVNEYPKMNVVGECWLPTPAFVSYWEGANRNRDGYTSHLPSVMDFPLQAAMIDAFKKPDMFKIYEVLTQDFVYAHPNTLFTFADNHDFFRLAHQLSEDPKKVKLAITLVATMRGVPQLYYGTELMFVGDPAQGDGGERMDFPGGWVGDKVNLFKAEDRNPTQEDIFLHTKTLFTKRQTLNALHDGKMMHYIPKDNMYVYFRYVEGSAVMVILNASEKPRKINWTEYAQVASKFNTGVDILTNKPIIVGGNLSIAPMTSMVIDLK